MFTLSFHGSYRGDLFYILDLKMKLSGRTPSGEADFHAMNGKAVGNGREHVPIPEPWDKTFGRYKRPWKRVKLQLQKMGCPEGYAPVWFVEDWAPAAIHSARRYKRKGSGVIVFDWDKYDLSVNCILEKLFCKCLIYKYPGSVFVMKRKSNGSQREFGSSVGKTLKRHESLRATLTSSLKNWTGATV